MMKFFTTCSLLLSLGSLTAAQLDPIVSYVPAEDVTEHAKIDLDIKEVGDLAGAQNYADAKAIYENGKNSKKGDENRTLKGFSTGIKGKYDDLAVKPSAPYLEEYKLFVEYYGSETYADEFVQEAFLDNSTTLAGIPDLDKVRKQLAVKGIQYQVVWMYIFRELYESLAACETPEDAAKPKNWDEGVAFYTGSIVAANPEANKFSGQSMYTLMEKRCGAFGQCKEGAPAFWNEQAMTAFKNGLIAVQADDCPAIAKNIKLLRKIMQIPLIQGTLQYAHKTNPTAYPNIEDVSMKSAAEAWAFMAGVLPFFNENGNNDADEAILTKNLILNAETHETFMKDGTEVVFGAVYRMLGNLCIKCSDIGVENMELGNGIAAAGAIPTCEDNQALLDKCDAFLLEAVTAEEPPADNNAVMIGLIVGCVVVLVLIGGIMWYCMRNADDQEVKVGEESGHSAEGAGKV